MGQINHRSLSGYLRIPSKIGHGPSSVGPHSWPEGILRQHDYRHLDPVVVVFPSTLALRSYVPAPTEYENAIRVREMRRREVFLYLKVGDLRHPGVDVLDDGDEARVYRQYNFLLISQAPVRPQSGSPLKPMPPNRMPVAL